MGVRTVVVALVALLSVACTPAEPADEDDRDAGERAAGGCGPVAFAEVRGRQPRYVDAPLAETPNDSAMCRGLWLPGTAGTAFVPQGLVVEGDVAFVSGYDSGRVGYKYCRVVKVDLRTGRKLDEQGPVGGRIGLRDPVDCRHGGGLSIDEHGLWLAEKRRLWLLDPATLETRRAWANVLPVWGSFVLHDGDGRLGLAAYAPSRRTNVHWFEPADLLAPGVVEVVASLAVDVERRVPPVGQGGVYADLGPGRARVWWVRSDTRCGQLIGGREHRYGFLPGAEGIDYADGRLWVVSEATARPYFRKGGRPVVPQLAAYDVRRLERWGEPPCEP